MSFAVVCTYLKYLMTMLHLYLTDSVDVLETPMGITFSDEYLDVHLDTTVISLQKKERKKRE